MQFICFIYTFYISFTESFIYLTLVAAAKFFCIFSRLFISKISFQWSFNLTLLLFRFLPIIVFVFTFTFLYMNLNNLNKPVVIFIFTTVVNGQT